MQAREQHLELRLLPWDVFQADASLTLFLLRGLGCVLVRCAGWDLPCSPRHLQ